MVTPTSTSNSTPSAKGSTSSSSSSPQVLIAGAGLVGTLCASMLAQRGYQVLLIEARPDPRQAIKNGRGRSINLALSHRGIEALRSVGGDRLVNQIVGDGSGLEMRGRMIHTPSTSSSRVKTEAQDYGIYEKGEVIRSISREELGNKLLDYVEEEQRQARTNGRVEIRFETKLIELDLRSEEGVKVVLGTKERGEEKLQVDWVIGGDGAYSRVRREMMRGSKTRFNYRQTYAKHSYLELSIPPATDGSWSIAKNFLHIWPRGEFMLIALPNQDKSFTLTLFAHQSTFDEIDEKLSQQEPNLSSNPVVDLFRKEFPDALELMGEEALLKDWQENPKDGLITVECSPYHYKDKALLIGDSAHAMVPFYGQGMNCAFEDVRFLSTLLDHYSAAPSATSASKTTPLPFSSDHPTIPACDPTKTPLANALQSYTLLRTPSLKAIQHLAAQNYSEMASSVLSPLYLIRLSLDKVLSKLLPHGVWDSLYRMTTFRFDLSYQEVLKRRAWQSRVIEWTATIGMVSIGLVGLDLVRRFRFDGRIPSLKLIWK